MADIISFADHHKKVKPTLEQLAATSLDEISTNWEKFARNNHLNDYFISNISLWVLPNVNYLTDLNALSQIEAKIKLALELRAPSQSNKQIGWVASFIMNGIRIETPFMFSEAYARCFNILLFLKLSRELMQHGISIN
jgi:hypothetical protein